MKPSLFTSIKPITLAVLVAAIYGCGAGSYRNQKVNVHDDNTIAYSANVESRLSPRLMIQGQANSISLSDSQTLASSFSSGREVLRANDVVWEGPDRIKKEADIQEFGLVLMASPVNNDFLEVNLGGGLRYLNGDLKISGDARSVNFGFVDQLGLSLDSYVKYKFHPNLALSGGVTGGYFDSSRQSLMASLGFNWTPIEHVQFDIGLFRYTYENDLSDRYDNTEDYQLQFRRIDADNTCSDDVTSNSCPEGDYDSAFRVKATGLRAGITFVF